MSIAAKARRAERSPHIELKPGHLRKARREHPSFADPAFFRAREHSRHGQRRSSASAFSGAGRPAYSLTQFVALCSSQSSVPAAELSKSRKGELIPAFLGTPHPVLPLPTCRRRLNFRSARRQLLVPVLESLHVFALTRRSSSPLKKAMPLQARGESRGDFHPPGRRR